MFCVSRDFHFCYGHRLASHPGRCRRLHGHNGLVRVTLFAGELNASGMVCDFTDLKAILGGWIEETLDHRILLDRDDPLRAVLQGAGESVVETDGPPTAERIALMIFRQAKSQGLPVRSVEFWETRKCRAIYSEDPFPRAPEETK
ncbi:MAG: 6-carboxytetrahydropterin synthase [Thermoguttaceae bacterium]|nr:6-carboxytetrahydropterin synthase [Thermoguttaceae bacterium]